jgi:hypothetical protein
MNRLYCLFIVHQLPNKIINFSPFITLFSYILEKAFPNENALSFTGREQSKRTKRERAERRSWTRESEATELSERESDGAEWDHKAGYLAVEGVATQPRPQSFRILQSSSWGETTEQVSFIRFFFFSCRGFWYEIGIWVVGFYWFLSCGLDFYLWYWVGFWLSSLFWVIIICSINLWDNHPWTKSN